MQYSKKKAILQWLSRSYCTIIC